MEPTADSNPVSRYRTPADGKKPSPNRIRKRLDTTQTQAIGTVRRSEGYAGRTETPEIRIRTRRRQRPKVPQRTHARQRSRRIVSVTRRREETFPKQNPCKFLDTTQRTTTRTAATHLKAYVRTEEIEEPARSLRRRSSPDDPFGADTRQRPRIPGTEPRSREEDRSETEACKCLDTTQRKTMRTVRPIEVHMGRAEEQ